MGPSTSSGLAIGSSSGNGINPQQKLYFNVQQCDNGYLINSGEYPNAKTLIAKEPQEIIDIVMGLLRN